MEANAHRHGWPVHHPADLGRGEPFKLGQEQDFPVAWVESGECLVHLLDQRVFLGLARHRLSAQLLVEPAPAYVRPSLVRENASRGLVQPETSRFASGYVVAPPPGDHEDLGDSILCVAA